MLYVDYNNDGLINNGTNTGLDPVTCVSSEIILYDVISMVFVEEQLGKGLSLSFILQGVGKRDMWIMNELFYPHYDEFSTFYDTQLDYWTPGTY